MAGTMAGGKRDRMILESVFRAIRADLTSRGWFDAGRQHTAITMIDEYPDEEGEVALNTLAISTERSYNIQIELGTLATEHVVAIFCDFFAQSDGLGRHVVGDIQAFLLENPVIPVYDYDLATPVVDFYTQVDEDSVLVRKSPRSVNPWQKHWHICEFRTRDERTNA